MTNITKEWLHQVSYHALADYETTEATYEIARICIERGIPGDFVECGVFAGAQIAAMGRACLDCNKPRWVHLFDTFTGIPLAGPQDEELQGKPAGISACSVDAVKANMERWGIPDKMLVYHPGLVQDTVPGVNDLPCIALLRLDVDLYDATAVCMEHLAPKVSRGGWICVDDFNLSGCRQAVLEKCVPAPIYWRIPTK